MANFPTSLDTSVTIPVESASTPLSTNHVTNHTASQTAIIALETKVGVDGSAVTTSHDYKLSGVTGSDKAVSKTGTETLTNKTLTSPTVTGATITTSTVNGVTIQTAGSATDFLAANGTYQTGAVANASTTVKGIVEAATSAEITAGTATGGTGAALVVTPDALAASTPVFNGSGLTNLTNPATYATGDTTYDLSTATGTQNIAHGLGKTPKYIKITYYVGFSNSATQSNPTRYGVGTFNGSTYTTWFTGSKSSETSNTYQSTYISTAAIIEYQNGGGGSSTSQVATASLNSTNIVLSWTKTNSPTGTLTILWEAFA